MKYQKHPLSFYLLKPSQGQIILSLLGVFGYFLYIYLSVNFFFFKDSHPTIFIYSIELTATLLACNITVIGNRYIGDRVDYFYIAGRPFDIKCYLMKLVIQVLFTSLTCNIIFTLDGLLTSESQLLLDVLATNIISFPFAVMYFGVENANTLIKRYKAQNIDIEKIEKEKLDSELQLLRSQFNPHFIFNAINTIYFQIEHENSAAKQILPQFKNMMTYLIQRCNHEMVPFEKEIEYIQNFTNIQLIRKGDDVKTNFEYSFDSTEYVISPFLLQPFIENAFKYISGNMELAIRLRIVNGNLHYTVKNSVDPAFYGMNTKKGVGLKNLKKRLQLIYPDRHFMQSNTKKDCFVAEMQLKLKPSTPA